MPGGYHPPLMPWRRPILLLLFAAALVAGGGAAYWQWSAGRLAAWIETWTNQQRDQGYEITYRGPEIDGFPFALTARFEAPGIASPHGWRWNGPPVTGRAALWNPFTVLLDFPGQHRINGTAPAVSAEIAALRAGAVVQIQIDGQIGEIAIEAEELSVHHPEAALGLARLRLRLGPVDPATEDRPRKLLLAGEIADATLPEDRNPPFGPTVEHLAFEADLPGEIPGGAPREILEGGRDAGGRLEVRRLEVTWGTLALEATGTLGLDNELRPEGTLTARLRDVGRTVDSLAATGLIKAKQARTAKVLLLALAGRPAKDGSTVVTLPVTLREGLLYLGPAPLLRLSPVL